MNVINVGEGAGRTCPVARVETERRGKGEGRAWGRQVV